VESDVNGSFVSNKELAALSVSSWMRVALAALLALASAGFAGAGFEWIALPFFFVCSAFVVWSLGSTLFYVVADRNTGGVFPAPLTPRDAIFARLIIKECIRR
jgi:hypothetical protein